MIKKDTLFKLSLIIGGSCLIFSLLDFLPFRGFIYRALTFFTGLFLISVALSIWQSGNKKKRRHY